MEILKEFHEFFPRCYCHLNNKCAFTHFATNDIIHKQREKRKSAYDNNCLRAVISPKNMATLIAISPLNEIYRINYIASFLRKFIWENELINNNAYLIRVIFIPQ